MIVNKKTILFYLSLVSIVFYKDKLHNSALLKTTIQTTGNPA
jgi:hypothetical protein